MKAKVYTMLLLIAITVLQCPPLAAAETSQPNDPISHYTCRGGSSTAGGREVATIAYDSDGDHSFNPHVVSFSASARQGWHYRMLGAWLQYDGSGFEYTFETEFQQNSNPEVWVVAGLWLTVYGDGNCFASPYTNGG